MRKVTLSFHMAGILISVVDHGSEGGKRAENFLPRPLGSLIGAGMLNAFEGELTLTRKGWARLNEARNIVAKEREKADYSNYIDALASL